jgi:tRNA modification GTPase
VRDTVRALTGREPPPPRRASLRVLRDPRSGELLDRALLLFFPGPASYTGEDMLEIQHHGGTAVVAALLDALSALPGLRLAEPGEFTRRAFLSGRLDLTEAEAVADLVEATTRAQARLALRQLEGALGRLCEDWRERVLALLAEVEAEIDFAAEEADVPEDLSSRVGKRLDILIAEIGAQLDDGGCGERLRAGITVAVTGPPNVGKSSLVNRLARRDVAIVTPIPGTTRDVIEVPLELDGLPVTLLDTAGLRETGDPVEAEGVRRARTRAAAADLRLHLVEAGAGPWPEPGPDTLLVVNKIDLLRPADLPAGAVALSCATGEGLDTLVARIAERARALVGTGTEAVITRARHREALVETVKALERAGAAGEPALLAEDLRLAARALGRITGRVDVEEVLDRIFARFCIGK